MILRIDPDSEQPCEFQIGSRTLMLSCNMLSCIGTAYNYPHTKLQTSGVSGMRVRASSSTRVSYLWGHEVACPSAARHVQRNGARLHPTTRQNGGGISRNPVGTDTTAVCTIVQAT